MRYTSIQQIQTDFNIQSNDLDLIKNHLNQLRSNLHPDKNNGDFRNEEEKNQYYKINDALEYVSDLKNNSQLMVIEKMTDLVRVVTELVPGTKEHSQQSKLEKKMENIIEGYRSRQLFPKISLTAVSAVMTFLFAIPSIAKDNPALARFIDPQNTMFIIIWLMLLFSTGMFWLMTLMTEDRLKHRLSMLNIDSTQNKIFEEFIYNKTEPFTKDELTEFIHRYHTPRATSLLPLGSHISTMEIAQSISEMIITRATAKGLLQITHSATLSDTYQVLKK